MALEARCVPTFFVDTSADTSDIMPGDGFAKDKDGKTSLRAAIQEGNKLGGNIGIAILPEYPENAPPLPRSIALTSALPDLEVNFGITGDFPHGDTVERPTISRAAGAAPFRIFTVGADSDSVLTYLAITGGDAGDDRGGGVFNDGKVSVSSCRVYGNVASSGGGISSAGQHVSLDYTAVWSNEAATGDGGGVEVSAGYGGLAYSQVYANVAKDAGGGVAANTELVTLFFESADVYGNTAGSKGGGIFSWGTLTMYTCKVSGNDATDAGGIYVSTTDGATMLSDLLIDGNSCTGDGGGLYVHHGFVASGNLTVTDNQAGGKGGGVYVESRHPGGVHLDFAWLADNTAGHVPSAGGYVDPAAGDFVSVSYAPGIIHQIVWFDE